MKRKRPIWAIKGIVSINNNLIEMSSFVNNNLYDPPFEFDSVGDRTPSLEYSKFVEEFDKCCKNVVTVMTSINYLIKNYSCDRLEFLRFVFSETEEETVITLLINGDISDFFMDRETFVELLDKTMIKDNVLEVGKCFIEMIGNRVTKDIKSEVIVESMHPLINVYNLLFEFKNDELFCTFDFNNFDRPTSDYDTVKAEIMKTDIVNALEEINRYIAPVILKYKEYMVEDKFSLILSSYLNDDDSLSSSVSINNLNSENFAEEINQNMLKEDVRDSVNYINRELLNIYYNKLKDTPQQNN